MDRFYERLSFRAATFDELLSDDFETLPGQKGDSDLAARRLAAWCRSCASGDWLLFNRRLARDGLTIEHVLSRFATVRRKASVSPPSWLEDAIWIDEALQSPARRDEPVGGMEQAGSCAFESLFTPVVARAEALLWSNIDARASNHFRESARACLRRSLIELLSDLATPAIYERFAKARKANARPSNASSEPREPDTSHYDQFTADMKAGGFRSLFEDKPVLLRLMATVTRQWIDVSRELVRPDHGQFRSRQSGRQDRERSLGSTQWRPLGPDHELRRRRADCVQAQGLATRCKLACFGRTAEPVRATNRT